MLVYIITIMILVCVYTIYMGYSDGANSVATSVTSRAIRPKTALAISSVMQFLSPIIMIYLLGNTQVSNTIQNMIYGSAFVGISTLQGFLFLLSALVGTLAWAGLSVAVNISSSTSHSLLGGIVGAGIAFFGWNNINWHNVGLKVILVVFITPIIAVIVSYTLQKIINRVVISMSIKANIFFKMAQAFNVALLAFSVSVNNVQKSLAVFVLAMVLCGFDNSLVSAQPYAIIILSFLLMLGLIIGGFRLINSVGRKIYKLDILEAFCTQISTTSVSIVSSYIGLPLSMGQIMTSSIVGVGMAYNVSAVRWLRVRKQIFGWIFTFPMASIVGALVGYVVKIFA